jgi:hypothetical protein
MIIAILVFILVGILAWALRPGKSPDRSRVIAILASVIPPSGVAIASVVSQLLNNAAGNIEVSNLANTLFIVSLGLIGAGIVVLAGFGIMRKSEIVKGIGFGLCIDVLLLIIEFGLLEWLAGV